jgi:large conductance mechanosensitive channel
MWDEFKEFINRGNVIELAVAVVIGAAFAPVVKAMVDGILMQIIAAVVGKPSFDDVVIPLNGTDIFIGTFITAVINFLIVAVVMFLVIKLYNMLSRKKEAEEEVEEEPTYSPEVQLLAEIRDLLRAR